ncbi:hypothetical protein NDU88_001638, partial [Pleurodeles waltl]
PVSGVTLSMDRISAEVQEGENLTLTCSVSMGSSPSFHWNHIKKEGDVASEILQLTPPTNILHIASVRTEHNGSYQCQARNWLNQNRTFSSTSNILFIKVTETHSAVHTVTAALIPLAIIAITVTLGFLYCKHKRKPTEDRTFTTHVSSPRHSSPPNSEQVYSNVPATNSSTQACKTEADVVYSIVDIQSKKKAPVPSLQEN